MEAARLWNISLNNRRKVNKYQPPLFGHRDLISSDGMDRIKLNWKTCWLIPAVMLLLLRNCLQNLAIDNLWLQIAECRNPNSVRINLADVFTSGFDQWSKAVSLKPNIFSCTVRNLNDGQQYLFRAVAKNSTGLGPAVTMSDHVLVAEQISPPDAELDGLSQKIVEGKAGRCITAEVCIFYTLIHRRVYSHQHWYEITKHNSAWASIVAQLTIILLFTFPTMHCISWTDCVFKMCWSF